jgi:hypothetical protein
MHEEDYGNEVLMLISGLVVLAFGLYRWRDLAATPHRRLLGASFATALCAWVMTVLEEHVWGDQLNLVEHSMYAVSACCLLAWCWRVRQPPRGSDAAHRGP